MAAVANKRKRDSQDMGAMRAAPAMVPGNEFDGHYLQTDDGMDSTDAGMDFAAVLAQHNADSQDVVEEEEDDDDEEEEEEAETEAQQPQHQQPIQQSHTQVSGSGGNDQSASDTAAAAMAQYHTMTVPQSTEQTFMAGDETLSELLAKDPSGQAPRTSSFGDFTAEASKDGQSSPNDDTSPTGEFGRMRDRKPTVGSDEWHKVRRDNHKEVERRRRETINEGINELAKIVPGCEKNKGSILARAVQFITQLKENETQNIEKWTLEKLLTEQAIAELSSSCDKMKAECQRAWAECEQWKKAAQKAGVSSISSGGGADGGGDEKAVSGAANGEDAS